MAMRENVEVLLIDLKPFPGNPRTHSKTQIEQLAASLKEFGFTNPLLIDEQNVTLAGHGRQEAAALAGFTSAPCVRITGLSDAQKKALVVADNKLALNAGWDDAALGKIVTELSAVAFNLPLMGFSAGELKDFGVKPIKPVPAAVFTADFGLYIDAKTEQGQQALFEELTKRGLECKIMN